MKAVRAYRAALGISDDRAVTSVTVRGVTVYLRRWSDRQFADFRQWAMHNPTVPNFHGRVVAMTECDERGRMLHENDEATTARLQEQVPQDALAEITWAASWWG